MCVDALRSFIECALNFVSVYATGGRACEFWRVGGSNDLDTRVLMQFFFFFWLLGGILINMRSEWLKSN